jgi:hypothetical protein
MMEGSMRRSRRREGDASRRKGGQRDRRRGRGRVCGHRCWEPEREEGSSRGDRELIISIYCTGHSIIVLINSYTTDRCLIVIFIAVAAAAAYCSS